MTEKRSDKQGAEVIPLPKRRPGGTGGGTGGGKGSGGKRRGERCPICGKAPSPEHRPFCSARCTEIDLGRWLKGVYRVPTEEAPIEEEATEPGRGNEEPE